jgi:hypothetical protein
VRRPRARGLTGPRPRAGYASNSDFLNHCIVRFLQRVCDPEGMNLEPMLYQARGAAQLAPPLA